MNFLNMGPIVSKFFRSDSKDEKVTKLDQVTDVRSMSNQIVRTPIVIDKKKYEKEDKEDKFLPLGTKLLKNIKLDPRSPTVGIYRTPILVEDSIGESKIVHDCDSPLSIYSCHLTESVLQDVLTPAEPSPNVSDFNNYSDVNDSLEPEDTLEENIRKKKLRVADRPNTYEARKLLDEIIMSEEENFLKKVSIKRKEKKTKEKETDKKIYDLKGKGRAPLSNITLSTNSPSQPNTGGKLYSRSRVLTEFGSENSSSPSVKHLAQWDKNNTVII